MSHPPDSAISKPTGTKPNGSDKQRLRLWLRMLRTTRVIEANLRERLRLEFDSTLPRFDVLAALHRQHQDFGPDASMTMTALSRQLLVSNGNATVIVDRLVADGLVARTSAAKDRRTTLVLLTMAGLAQFTTMAAAHERWVADILADLTSVDADQLITLLDRAAAHSMTKESSL